MRRSSLLFTSLLVAVAIYACGSSDDGNPGDQPGGPNAEGGTSSGGDGSSGDGSSGGPIVKKEFPTALPALGGYTLVDAYPGVVFDIPSAIAWPKTGGDPFVFERTGQIRRIVGGTTRTDVLDISDQVHVEGEGGALGLVLHPKFGDGSGHDYAYVWYNACDVPGCDNPYTQRLDRYTWNGTAFDAGSLLRMIEEREFQPVHNAAKMNFGADGFLYFGNGDDATNDNHQTITNALFAGIFRIDVDSDPSKSHAIPAGHTTLHAAPFTRQGYMIPNDNPFVNAVPNGLEEFWALGFRNPFDFTFDRQTGDMWMGDVGESFREEVNKVVKGGNYQWPIKEGEMDNLDSEVSTYTVGTSTPPVFYYSHAEDADLAAVFGGFIYRGKQFPELVGKYIYGDWISNKIWALDVSKTPVVRTTLIDNQYLLQPMSMGEDNDGEIYFVQYGQDKTNYPDDFGGHIKKLAKDTTLAALPQTLSATYLFTSLSPLTPAADLIPYEVSSPLWSDGAQKTRWLRLPPGQKIGYNQTTGELVYPKGTMFIKQFDTAADITPAGRGNHLETRIMMVGDTTTWGYTFRWNAANTDATMNTEPTDETLTDQPSGATRNWHYPSFGQCWNCHRDDANTGTAYIKDKWRILGFTAEQLGVMVNGVDQRMALAGKGVFDPADVAMMPAVIPNPSDTTQTAETRAFAYLAANCSPCHHEGASYLGGGQTWLATWGAGDYNARGLNQQANNYPMSHRLGLPGGNLVVAGQPDKSVLLQRIISNDPDLRMPPIARNVTDPTGVAVVTAWIQQLTP